MTSLCLWGPVELPGAALWHGHPPESDSAVSKNCPEAGDAVHEGGLKSFGKLNVFICFHSYLFILYSLSIHYQFLSCNTSVWHTQTNLYHESAMMQDLHAITVPIFAHQEDCQFFSGRLCTPESSLRHAQKMKRKVPFPTHVLHPPCGHAPCRCAMLLH